VDFAQPAHGQLITARKTAFYVDAALLFVGSGISSAPSSRVTTTVESRLLSKDGIVAAGLAGSSLVQLAAGTHLLPSPKPTAPLLVYHAGTGYVFPVDPTRVGRAGASVSLSLGPVSGSWEVLNGDPDAPNVTNDDVPRSRGSTTGRASRVNASSGARSARLLCARAICQALAPSCACCASLCW